MKEIYRVNIKNKNRVVPIMARWIKNLQQLRSLQRQGLNPQPWAGVKGSGMAAAVAWGAAVARN